MEGPFQVEIFMWNVFFYTKVWENKRFSSSFSSLCRNILYATYFCELITYAPLIPANDEVAEGRRVRRMSFKKECCAKKYGVYNKGFIEITLLFDTTSLKNVLSKGSNLWLGISLTHNFYNVICIYDVRVYVHCTPVLFTV